MPKNSWPRGDSEMAALIRSRDWSQTPLGPVKSWPQNLRTSVDIMLGACARIGIYWGKEHILLYNDAWKELIGDKHPDALGKPAREIFPEIWEPTAPELSEVLAAGKAFKAVDQHLPLNRHGRIEDAWFDFSFNPIPGRNGSPEGILNIAKENTEQIQAEKALKKSERKYKELIQKAPAAIYEIDFRNRKFTSVNDAVCEMLGYSREEMLEMDPFDILDKKGRKLFQTRMGKWLKGEKPDANVEFTAKTREGRKIDVLLDVTFTKDKNGNPLGATVVGRDITLRKQAERKLDRQKELLEGIIGNIPVSLVIWDGKLQEFNFNKEFRSLTGWTEADAAESDFMAKVYPDPEYRREVKKFMQSHKSGWRDMKTTAKDGRELDISWANVHLSGDRSIGIGIDVRERKHFEERLLWQNRVLEGINRIFQETLTARTDEELGAACLDAATEVTESRFGFIGEIGRDGMFHDIAVNNPGWDRCTMHDKSGHRKPPRDFKIAGLYGKVLKDGKSLIANNPSSHPSSTGTPEGHPRLSAFLGVPLHRNGNITGMIAMANRKGGYREEDLDALEVLSLAAEESLHRKRMEEEVREYRRELEIRVRERTAELTQTNRNLQQEIIRRERAEEQLLQAQKLESMGTMTGGIAHDFNNILGAIVLNSELSLFDLPKDSSVRNNIDSILQAALRGKNLIRQMLLFSRKSEKKQKVFPLTPLIKETFNMLRASIPSTVKMDCRSNAESDLVNADPGQIQQVLMNLCTNAAYALRGMKGTLDISLNNRSVDAHNLRDRNMQPGDYVVLSVKDSGPGIKADVQKRIFEPFFTTKPVGEGTGLGLSVAYGIIKNHQGHIKVESKPGEGTVFNVYLPKSESKTGNQEEGQESLPGGKEHILFVDDEPSIVSSVKNMLHHLGYTVTAANKSKEAFRIFSQDPSRFDLVITDQTMPEMTGKELGQEMMKISSDTPVILCTGYSDMISSEKIMAAGFRGCIMKPFTLKEGAELIRRVLDECK